MEALYTLISTVLSLGSIEVTRAAVLPITQQLRHAGFGAMADRLLNAGGARARVALLVEALDAVDPCTCPTGSGHGTCGYCMTKDCDEHEASLPPQIVVGDAASAAGYSLGVVAVADRSCSSYQKLDDGRQHQYDWVRAEDRMFNVHPWNGSLAGVGGYGIRWEVNLDRGLDSLERHEADGARGLGFFPCDVPDPSTDSGPNGVGGGGNSTADTSAKLHGEIDFDYGLVCSKCGAKGLSEVHVPGDLCDDCYKLKADAGTACAAQAPALVAVEAEDTDDTNLHCLTEAQEAAIRSDLRKWDGAAKDWGFRKSYPPKLRTTEHGRRCYFVWRMTRFHAGVDMKIPVMAMAVIDGDPAEAALDQLAGLLAEQYYGTQLAAAATWIPLLGTPRQ